MAKYQDYRQGYAALLRSRGVQEGCVREAEHEAARLRAVTPRDTGETAASTRVEAADFGGRKGALIVQDGAAVAVHFGNARTKATHYAFRGR